jgi:peptidoglycan/LPS O-acetylase OafA/YrhL
MSQEIYTPISHQGGSHPGSHYRPDIDGLRALAIGLVVLYHAFPALLPGGFIGVDVFFVISGFLISSIIYQQLSTQRFSFLDFYIRRIKRIFPALLIVLISCFALGWFTLLADEYKQLGKHITGGAGFISNLILWDESGYFDQASHLKPLLHLWSLGIEEQFYFIWPLIIYIAWKKQLNLLAVACLIFAISFALNIYQIYFLDHLVTTFYLPHTRFWELMAGAILAYITHTHTLGIEQGYRTHLRAMFSPNLQSSIGIACIVIGVAYIHEHSLFPGYWATLPVLGAVLLINAGPGTWINRTILSNRFAVWLGLISFPLYLWHWPTLVFARIIEGGTLSTSYRIAAVLIAIGLSWLTYLLIEKPIRFGGHPQIKAIILTVLMCIVAFIGYNTYTRDGLNFRLSQIQFRLPPVLQSLGQVQSPGDHQRASAPKDQSPIPQSRPQIWLWGDSYAGHLIAGYQARFGQDFEIVRLNTNGCPPILGLELAHRRNCSAANQAVLERIANERPFKVVLAANWTDYDWRQVQSTLIALEKVNYHQIDIVGPAPQWNDSLYKQLYLNYMSTKNPEIPKRMQFGLNPNFLDIEPKLMALANEYHVNYISIVNILCNPSGCITRFGDTADTLASFDGGHFTDMASQYVVRQFPRLGAK